MIRTLDQFFRNHLEEGVAIERVTLQDGTILVCLATTDRKGQLICVLPISNLSNSPEGRVLYKGYHILTMPLVKILKRDLPNRHEKLCYLNACFDTYLKHIKKFFSEDCLNILRRIRAGI